MNSENEKDQLASSDVGIGEAVEETESVDSNVDGGESNDRTSSGSEE